MQVKRSYITVGRTITAELSTWLHTTVSLHAMKKQQRPQSIFHRDKWSKI